MRFHSNCESRDYTIEREVGWGEGIGGRAGGEREREASARS